MNEDLLQFSRHGLSVQAISKGNDQKRALKFQESETGSRNISVKSLNYWRHFERSFIRETQLNILAVLKC